MDKDLSVGDLPRLLVTGATGLLGHRILKEAAGTYRLFGISRHPDPVSSICAAYSADLLCLKDLHRLIQETRPNIIIHTASLTSVEQCEREPERAFSINVQGTRNLLQAIQGLGCRFLFISTDSVFDGEAGNYREEDKPCPLHTYGRTKREAEEAVLSLRPDGLVVRTCFYGRTIVPRSNLAEWIFSSLREGKEIPGFTDLYFSPIPSTLLARLLLELAAGQAGGILHLAGSESCSKYEFARRFAAAFGFPPERVLPTTSDQAGLPVPRPRNVTLCVEKASALLGRPLPDIAEGLRFFEQETVMSETKSGGR